MIKQILRGVMIGVANIIPGVSGGTMAVSMGIYDKMIYAITHIFSDFKNSMKILIPIIIGAVLSIIGISFLIEKLFVQYPMQTNLLFVGLILGGLPAILKRTKGAKVSIDKVLAFLLFFGLVIGFAVIGGNEGGAVDVGFNLVNGIKLFGVGVIASATMVIPGVSGSMILMLMGYYTPVIASINSFIKSLLAFQMEGILAGVGTLIPFGLGIVLGIFAIAKMIEYVFERFPMTANFAIVGLIFASPFAIILSANLGEFTILNILTSVVTFGIGFTIAYHLGDEPQKEK